MTKFWRLEYTRNAISVSGAMLTTVGAVLFLVMFFLDVFGYHTNPYVGILFFLVFPTIFIAGLVLIPIGMAVERNRRHLKDAGPRWPRLDLNDDRQRNTVLLVLVVTLVNVVIVSLAAYKGVEYMDSVAFCGQVCHDVMQPEFVAYQDGPHSRVSCVGCHIGPGAPWFVRSKLSGLQQVLAVAANTYPRPNPSPVRDLRPARDTCEQCHWPEKFHGDKVMVVHEYGEDEENTEEVTTLRIHVGGGSDRLGIATGIHWHMNVANEVEYIATDDRRQVIPWVRLQDRFGTVREFTVDGVTPEELERGERRQMDCVDCHNRPSHPFATSAVKAVDASMATGEISPELPFIKREVTAALEGSYPSQTAGEDAIAVRLRQFYRTEYSEVYMSERQVVERAVAAAQGLYRRNVFPAMNVQWGTYPNNVGHMDFPGCFRCHDDEHVAEDGSVIRQDCDICHDFE